MKVEIEFAQWLSGHDRETVEQMYQDWQQSHHYVTTKPYDLCCCTFPDKDTAGIYCSRCQKYINKTHF